MMCCEILSSAVHDSIKSCLRKGGKDSSTGLKLAILSTSPDSLIRGLFIVLKQASYYKIRDVRLPLATILEFLCDSTSPVETEPLNDKRM
jgi:hypothetical protein